MRRGEEGMCYPILEGWYLTYRCPKWVIIPLKCHQPAKNQQAKACWKCCKSDKKLVKNFVVKTRNFPCKFQQVKYV